MKFYLKTFGCQQNYADSNKIESSFKKSGFKKTSFYKNADVVILNTCMIRESAENRVYGLINNLKKLKEKGLKKQKIIITGCMAGMAINNPKLDKLFKKKLKIIDEFVHISKLIKKEPGNSDLKNKTAYVSISNGCNNFCSYCVVPYARGKEISKPFEKIIKECQEIYKKGFKEIMLLGQNVNSYGADLKKHDKKVTYVKHLGKNRIPTLFPHLLEEISKIGFKKISFMSSNPWDFSNELIKVIKKNKNIDRTIHLPLQSGDDRVLKLMNRWYTSRQYLSLINKIKKNIPEVKFTTDIIVGFCTETDKEFKNTYSLCKKINFEKAYVSIYSTRPGTYATKNLIDNVSFQIKKQRWQKLEELINKPYLVKLKNQLKAL